MGIRATVTTFPAAMMKDVYKRQAQDHIADRKSAVVTFTMLTCGQSSGLSKVVSDVYKRQA